MEVELTAVTEGSPIAGWDRVPFSVVFAGDKEGLLLQGTYEFEHDELGSFPIFVSPITPDAQGRPLFEAVFG